MLEVNIVFGMIEKSLVFKVVKVVGLIFDELVLSIFFISFDDVVNKV